MSALVITSILCAALVLAILIGTIRKVNIGILGIVFSYVIGCMILKMSPAAVIALFPVKLLFITMSTTLFFGFAIENGTIGALADRILYCSKNIPWTIPIVLAILATGLGMMGADTVSVVAVLAPMGYVLSKKAGFHPLLVVVGVGAFAAVGSAMAWSSVGAMCRGIISHTFHENAFRMENASAICSGIIYLIIFVILYIALKGFKVKKIEMDKPAPLTAVQRKNIVIVFIVLAVVMIPLIVNAIMPNQVTIWMKSKFDIQMVVIVGAALCSILKLADERTVITKRVPWSLILMVCGISMLIGLAEVSGVIDMISGVISENVSTKAIQPLLIAIGSLLSFVTNGISGVLIPFTPMLPSISEATGVSTTTLFACIGTSVSLTCLSPFSMGGSFILGFADHADQKKLMVQQIILAIVVAALGVILSFTGLYSILG